MEKIIIKIVESVQEWIVSLNKQKPTDKEIRELKSILYSKIKDPEDFVKYIPNKGLNKENIQRYLNSITSQDKDLIIINLLLSPENNDKFIAKQVLEYEKNYPLE